jgi:hypothetical protein
MRPSLFFESLFKRNLADTGNTEFLKRVAEEHPYFSPAQFYLLQQKNPGSEDYISQASKTSVLFNNPYWLNFQLLQTQQYADISTETVVLNEEDNPVIEENNIIIQNDLPANQEIELSPEKKETLSYSNGSDDQLIFQPLYATDYFASQGIKLSEEAQATDKLGKQLKSFTDWLKTMKKINPTKILDTHSAQTDITVETLAEKSNTEGEVLTETMAEIFIQQRKTEKAIETYQKLSLLNPAKSAYFAAKIEQLKEH